MKHFFFSYDQNSWDKGILNDLFKIYIGKNKETDENLMAFYDAVDIIYDKRLEQEDAELKKLINKNEDDSNFYEILNSYRVTNESGEYYRIKALKILWSYIEQEYKIFESSNIVFYNERPENQHKRLINQILYHLVRGNICLRISQCYYENFDLKNSDIWGNRAIEILWHGKNLAANLRDSSCSQKKLQADLYLRLIKLNLAKYYRDYARRNRRSDFDAALDEFKQVRQRVENQIEGVSNNRQRRQYVLIWMDAVFNIISIHRRKYQVNIAEREILFFYYCQKEKFTKKDPSFHTQSNSEFPQFIKMIDVLTEICGNENINIESLLSDTQTKADFPNLCIKSFDKCDDLDNYDRRRYLLLTLLELSRIRRNLHFTENYLMSMATAIIADKWSYEMDKRCEYKPGHNIDALITVSSSLRKYIKFQNATSSEEEPLNEITIKIKNTNYSLYLRNTNEDIEDNVSTILSFIQKLKKFSENGYLKFKEEIIKWYCLYQQNRELLKDIKGEVGDYSSISEFFDDRNLNLQLRFLKGLVYLRSEKYTDAVGIFEELISPVNKETQYIRFGTIGLKARYLLANCYMSLAEFSKAEKILKVLKNTLKLAKENRINQGVLGSTDAEIDERVEIDLGYCYMQRGEYGKAIEVYKTMYGCGGSNETIPEFNLRKVKQEHLIMGLNNYAACCILSINDKKREDIEQNDTVEISKVKEKIEIARKIFIYMDTKFFEKNGQYILDPETNLLKGYYTLCTGIVPQKITITDEQVNICRNMTDSEYLENRKQALVKAHKYFRAACRYDDAFTSRYSLIDENGTGNKAKYRNEVERISVFIISLTKLYKQYLANKEQIEKEVIKLKDPHIQENMEEKREQLEYQTTSKTILERLLLSFPTTYKISLKAAIALAEWLLGYEANMTNDSENKSKTERLVSQMYRSFSYVTIYEERGAQVFNILRNNSKFRFFTAEQRGKFLALLLAMYKPIKAIKEECCFNLNDKEFTQSLVHYTNIENLKKMLAEEASDSIMPAINKDDSNLKHFEELYMMVNKDKLIPQEIRNKLEYFLYISKKEELRHLKPKNTEPRFRINNCGYMNDVFEGNIFLKGIALVSNNTDSEYPNFIKKYFPQINRSHENMSPSGSNVYIGSLSVKEDSFPMWSVYSANESGCNIEFGEGFFDIDGIPYFPRILREYMLSKYTDQDYPLYIVQYINSEFEKEYQKYQNSQRNKHIQEDEFEIIDAKGHRQVCGTEAICPQDLFRLLEQIYKRWKQLDEYLEGNEFKDILNGSKETIYAFASDRINEIRFLFKDADYEFEGEVRVVYTDSTDNSVAKTDVALDIPHVYVNIDREIEGLTVRLGSRIEDAIVDKYVTWLKHTKRVQKVELAKRNRYIT